MERIPSIIMIAVLCLTIFSSCSNVENPITNPEKYPVCYVLKQDFELYPFSKTRSIPDYRPTLPQTKTESDEAVLYNQIEYVVYDKESGAVVKSQTFTEENSDDFGVYLYDELEAGTYIIVLVAHSSSDVVLIGNQAIFSEVTDAFYATKEMTVGPENEETPVEVVLKRMVAKVEFVGTKTVPLDASLFAIEIDEQYNSTNLKDFNDVTARTLKKEYPLAGGASPEDALTYSFYTFVPEPLQGDTSLLSGVKLITFNTNQDTLHTIRLNSIPVMKNRITRYTGSLYAPNSNSNTLELEVEDNGIWKDTIQVPF